MGLAGDTHPARCWGQGLAPPSSRVGSCPTRQSSGAGTPGGGLVASLVPGVGRGTHMHPPPPLPCLALPWRGAGMASPLCSVWGHTRHPRVHPIQGHVHPQLPHLGGVGGDSPTMQLLWGQAPILASPISSGGSCPLLTPLCGSWWYSLRSSSRAAPPCLPKIIVSSEDPPLAVLTMFGQHLP